MHAEVQQHRQSRQQHHRQEDVCRATMVAATASQRYAAQVYFACMLKTTCLPRTVRSLC